MAQTIVQKIIGNSASGGSTSIAGADGWVAPTAGNVLVAFVSTLDATSTVTGPSGFTQIANSPNTGTTSKFYVYRKTADGTETSLSVSKSGTVSAIMFALYELSGTATTEDTSGGGTLNTTNKTETSPSLTPSGANYIMLFGANFIAGSGTAVAASNSFTVGLNGRAFRESVSHKIVTAGSGALSTVVTITVASVTGGSGMGVAFLASGGAAATYVPQMMMMGVG